MKGIRVFKQETTKIPHDPRDWKGFFQICHLDECNGERTPQTHIQIVSVGFVSETDEEYIFKGIPSKWEHPKSGCSFNNHTNGMHFAIVCTNNGIGKSFMWLREVDNGDLGQIMAGGKTFEMEGSSPDVPLYRCTGIVTVTVESRNHVLYLKEMHLTIGKAEYNEWLKVLI